MASIAYRRIAKLIELPHLLYTGANGRKTFGITVESINPSPVRAKVWNINDRTFMQADDKFIMSKIGLSEKEYQSIMDNFKSLLEQNKS